jgi:hypothetical protein
MVLVLRAHRLDAPSPERSAALDEAEALLMPIFTEAFQLARYSDAGAAALMLGVVSAVREKGDGDEVTWFAQAVAALARGRQLESLWRAHSNLAAAFFARGEPVEARVREHARAAVAIVEETLSPYPQPDRSARFRLVRTPLAQAVRFLLLADDPLGVSILERYPALRASFADVDAARLRDPHDEVMRYFEWLRVGEVYYVLY